MKLGVFLSIGESFADFRKKGQETLIINSLIKNYSNNFEKVYVFSYGKERFSLFHNVEVVPNLWGIHRYLYSILLPLFHYQKIISCDVLRGLQITGSLPGILSKFLFRKRIVVNFGYDYSRFALVEQKYLQYILYQAISVPLLMLVDKIILPAAYLQQLIPTIITRVKISIIPNGVDTKKFLPVGVVKNKKIILYVGRLEKQKNLKSLIQAMASIDKQDLKLVMIGAGSQHKELLVLARDISVKLEIRKPVSHDQLPKIFQKAFIFALPSYIEGQPKVLLEAMSCGLPIVASRIAAHEEIIKDQENGILHGISAKEIARSIRLLLDNPQLRRKISKSAHRSIIEKFDMRIRNKKEISLLKNLAGYD